MATLELSNEELVEGQVQYCLRKREKLLKAYRKLYDKWMK